jgi:hypothetical protein
MEINWNIKHTSGLTISYYAFSDVKRLISRIRETLTADFVVRHETKTSLSAEISCTGGDGHDSFAVGHIPKGGEKFKYHERTVHNIFYGTTATRRYFKLTKTQGLPELKEYLRLVLLELMPDVPSLTVNLTLYRVPELESTG